MERFFQNIYLYISVEFFNGCRIWTGADVIHLLSLSFIFLLLVVVVVVVNTLDSLSCAVAPWRGNADVYLLEGWNILQEEEERCSEVSLERIRSCQRSDIVRECRWEMNVDSISINISNRFFFFFFFLLLLFLYWDISCRVLKTLGWTKEGELV